MVNFVNMILFDKNPFIHTDAVLIEKVTDLEDIRDFIDEQHSGLGTGGMYSKIEAIKVCMADRVEVCLTNGFIHFFIEKVIKQEIKFTRFIPERISS